MGRLLIGTWLCSILFFLNCFGSAEFYVDPNWRGSGKGTSAAPWTQLDPPAWQAINSALQSEDVIVYFPARMALADECVEYSSKLLLDRHDTSAHRLTLDGKSKFNSSEHEPDWKSYQGNARCVVPQINTNNDREPPFVHRYNLTVRGFAVRVTSGQGLHISSCIDCTFEDLDVSHNEGSRIGPNIIIDAPVRSEDLASRRLVIRNSYIHHSFGELIYINGAKQEEKYGGVRYGASDILIEGNRFESPAFYGGEGDGIDIKDGIRNVVIRKNTFDGGERGRFQLPGFAIVSQSGTGLVIEQNIIKNWTSGGIGLGVTAPALPNRSGASIRNNFIDNCGGEGANSEFGISIRGRNNIKGSHQGATSETLSDSNANFLDKRKYGRSGVTQGFLIRNNNSSQVGKVVSRIGRNQLKTTIEWHQGDEWEILLDNWSNVELEGNVITRQKRRSGNDGGGLIIFPQAHNIRLVGNIVFNNSGINLTILPGGAPVTQHENNVYFSPELGAVLVRAGKMDYMADKLNDFEPTAVARDPEARGPLASPASEISNHEWVAGCVEYSPTYRPQDRVRSKGVLGRSRTP